jgi:hypothetical protein
LESSGGAAAKNWAAFFVMFASTLTCCELPVYIALLPGNAAGRLVGEFCGTSGAAEIETIRQTSISNSTRLAFSQLINLHRPIADETSGGPSNVFTCEKNILDIAGN